MSNQKQDCVVSQGKDIFYSVVFTLIAIAALFSGEHINHYLCTIWVKGQGHNLLLPLQSLITTHFQFNSIGVL